MLLGDPYYDVDLDALDIYDYCECCDDPADQEFFEPGWSPAALEGVRDVDWAHLGGPEAEKVPDLLLTVITEYRPFELEGATSSLQVLVTEERDPGAELAVALLPWVRALVADVDDVLSEGREELLKILRTAALREDLDRWPGSSLAPAVPGALRPPA